MAVIADQYSAHYSYVVREFIKKNRRERPDRDIQMVRLPVGCPYLNVVEQCWNRLKRAVVVGEHHATFEDLRRAASRFMRTARFNFSLGDCLYAKPPPTLLMRPRSKAAAGHRSPRGAAVRACASSAPRSRSRGGGGGV